MVIVSQIMKKVVFNIILIFFLFDSCTSNKESSIIDVIKNEVDSSNCFVNDRPKFVSLFFSKQGCREVVQMITCIDMPYKSNVKCYYMQDSAYIYVCSGYCEDFRIENSFSEWNDSMSNQYLSCHHYMNMSDSLSDIYEKNFSRIEPKYYEYSNHRFIYIDSITMDEKYIIDCQADSFSIGYRVGPFPEPPLQEE